MFLRKVTTKKNGKDYVYVKLIEGYRAEGKVKQRVLANFGSLESLTPSKIQSLIISLGKLHQELGSKNTQEKNLDKQKEIKEAKQRLLASPIHNTLSRMVRCSREQELTQALILKNLVGGGGNLSIQEYSQRYQLSDGTNIQYYQMLKKLGHEDIRKAIYEQWLIKKCCEKSRTKVVYIHILPVIFKGAAYEGMLPELMFMPECYKKQLIVLLACDSKGNPIEFDYAEGLKHLAQQVDAFAARMKSHGQADVIILDGENHLKMDTANYRIARKQSSKGSTEDCFTLVEYQPHAKDKQKTLQAKIAKSSAGLEMLKADILLGKLTQETSIMKKASAILKENGCQELITCTWDSNEHSLLYEVNKLTLNSLNYEKLTSDWYVNKNEKKPVHPKIIMNLGGFGTIHDLLQVPLVNACAEYHYTPEIISAHILLEIIKSQHDCKLPVVNQGVENLEYLQCCI